MKCPRGFLVWCPVVLFGEMEFRGVETALSGYIEQLLRRFLRQLRLPGENPQRFVPFTRHEGVLVVRIQGQNVVRCVERPEEGDFQKTRTDGVFRSS